MHWYTGKSLRKIKTHTGALPQSIGFPRGMQGVTRELTAEDIAQQKRNLKFIGG
jgi:hypothetical protein